MSRGKYSALKHRDTVKLTESVGMHGVSAKLETLPPSYPHWPIPHRVATPLSLLPLNRKLNTIYSSIYLFIYSFIFLVNNCCTKEITKD